MTTYSDIDPLLLLSLREEFLNAVDSNYKIKSHGLGLAQIILPEVIIDGFQVNQFHIWDKRLCLFPEEQTGHSHRFDMLSFVLSGEIDNIDVRLSDGEDYKVGIHLDNGDDFNFDGFVSIKTEKVRVSDGQKYFMSKDEFHQFDVPNNALTFVCKKNLSGLNKVLFPTDIPFKSGCSEDMRKYLNETGLIVVTEMYNKIKELV
jgi:hypothetical protein